MKDTELFRILMKVEDGSITKSEAQEQIFRLFGVILSFCNSCIEVHWLYEDNLCERCLKNRNKQNVIGSDIRRYIGSICDKCGEMSNHDEIDEDICIHCKTRSGTWKHIYEPPI